MKFRKFDTVLHVLSKRVYEVKFTPDECRIEKQDWPAYGIKSESGMLWVLPELDMEDGRFRLLEGKRGPATYG